MDNVPFTLTAFEAALLIWAFVATTVCCVLQDKLIRLKQGARHASKP